MTNNDYTSQIKRLAEGALAQLYDYLGLDIETPGDVVMLENRAVGSAAKLVYFNTIKHQLELIEAGQQQPADCLVHLDKIARAWMDKGAELRDLTHKGAATARALSDRWRNWALRGPYAKERSGFVDHFSLPE